MTLLFFVLDKNLMWAILESTKNAEAKKLLSETNKLLKEVGSKVNFIPKEQDI